MELRYDGVIELRDVSNFRKLLEPEVVGRAFPGVTAIEREGEWYKAKMVLNVGSLRGALDVRFRYAEISEEGATVVGATNGLQSTVDFTLKFLRKDRQVLWSFVGNARGLIATLGRPLLDAVAKSLIAQVVSNLRAIL